MKTALTVLSVLVGIAFIFAGATKLTSPEEMLASFERFGYPHWFVYFIGAAEVAGGIGLMVPKLRGWAATGLVLIMIGAVYSHFMHDPIEQTIPAAVLGVLCIFIASKSPKALICSLSLLVLLRNNKSVNPLSPFPDLIPIHILSFYYNFKLKKLFSLNIYFPYTQVY